MRKVIKTEIKSTVEHATTIGIGNALRGQRTSEGMTIEQAARLLGVSKNTYCAMEGGTGKASLSTYLAAMNVLGIKVSLRCEKSELNAIQKAQERAFLISPERARRAVVHWNHEAHADMGF